MFKILTLFGEERIFKKKFLVLLDECPSHPSKASPLMGKKVSLPLLAASLLEPKGHFSIAEQLPSHLVLAGQVVPVDTLPGSLPPPR